MALLTSAPAVGIIDSNNNLTLSWTPVGDPLTPLTPYVRYDHWNITVDATVFRSPTSGAATIPPVTQTFIQTLSAGTHSLTMVASDSVPAALTLPWQTSGVNASRNFPAVLSPTAVTLSLSSVLLGQTLTVTLSALYTGADQWQIIWPDNSSTGWLPLSANVVAKAFSIPGAQNITVQTRRDYSGAQYNPPASLIRQTSVQVFVVDQQFSGTTAQQGGLTGDLGIGGQQGFEITDASSVATTPNAWEVIARALVRDTITNELKLLVATSRFSNASSLFGTMALDVFPIVGRPHSIELIEPIYELEVTNTSVNPVKVATTALPSLIVGKSVSQALGGTLAMTTKANTGVSPFLWSATGLPPGVSMSSSGIINGVPQQLGTFSVVFAVQDSDIPFSIAEAPLTMTVTTDLLVQIASGQKDANNTALAPLGATLGVAQVLKPFTVQMQVGNTNPAATQAGGLPPYTWSIPAGALPVGLAIDPNTGIISGLPSTYNSTSDYQKTYTAIVQVTDAIGAKATQTYTMTLIAAPLQFSLTPDQRTIYSAQDFKLAVSIFGGQSPYTFDSFAPPITDTSYYTVTPTTIIDGQVEIVADVPTTGTGTRTFTLTAHDANATSKSQAINYQVQNEISDVRMIPAFFNHYWAAADSVAVTIPVVGSLSGYTLGGTTIVLTSVANASGGSTVYTGAVGTPFAQFVGTSFTVQGFVTAANNGQFTCTAATATTLTLNNAAGVSETHAAKAIVNLSPSLSNGIAIDVDPTVPQVTATGTASSFNNSQLRIPLNLIQSTTTAATISREYTFVAHNDTSNPGDIGTITTFPHPYIVGDFVFLNPRKPYFNSPNFVSFNATPNTLWTARVQAGSSLPPGCSFDSNTGLIYGQLVGLSTVNSIIEYIDGGGTVHGTVTIIWTTYQNDFPLIDTLSAADGAQIGTPYAAPGTIVLTAPPNVILSNPTVVYPRLANIVGYGLPAGVSFVADNSASPSVVRIVGTPIEAGYFDVWVQVNGNSNQLSSVYHRLAIDFTKPMVILTSSLPAISAQPYSVTLNGFGGIPPYTWSSPQFPAGSGTGNFLGLSITSNADNTGTISGTLTTPPGSSPTDLGNVTVNLADTRGALSSVNKVFDLVYNNNLRITTTAVPTIPASTDYGFAMSAAGGVPPYTWSIANSPTLPNGITFDAIAPAFGTTGAFSGTYTGAPSYSPTAILITVKDSTLTTASQSFVISTGSAALLIDQSKVGSVNRGVPYQGTLTLQNGTGNFVTPISWQVAPTATSPNTILTGLSLLPDSATLGVNAIIAGTYIKPTGTPPTIPHQVENIVRIVGNGTTAVVTTQQVHGFQVGQTVIMAGTVAFNGSFTITAVASDWTTFSFASAVVSTENPTTATATVTANIYKIRVTAVDATNQLAVALVTLNTSTDLQVTSTSLPNATVGGSYSFQLTATGGITPYTWTLDPLSAATFSGTGLSLSGAGVISGTASGIFNNSLTFRVSDNLNGGSPSNAPNIARATLTLASQATGLAITTASITPATSGVAYSFQLQAAGSPNTPYTWSIISGALPTGLSLSSAGVISGTTTLTGFSQSITFQVQDTIAAHVSKAFTFSVTAGLTLKTGVDITDGTNTGILGFVATGQVAAVNPRPNLSFFVVASGIVSTSAATMSVSVGNPNISATITSVSGGVAQIQLSGNGFDAGSVGSNNLSVSVTDNGVNVTNTFTWVVYNDGSLRIGATLPTELTTP